MHRSLARTKTRIRLYRGESNRFKRKFSVIVRKLSFLLVIVLLIVVLSYYLEGLYRTYAEQKIDEFSGDVDATIKTEFKSFSARLKDWGADGAVYVWRGSTSTVLDIEKTPPSMIGNMPLICWRVLAVTRGGNFFEVTYRLQFESAVQIFSRGERPRLFVSDFRAISSRDARHFLIRRNRIEVYESIFKEKFPTQEKEA